ncbi:GrpB family protein [Mucilaginibacter sp.]|uniref:GrpB family protein n=1 Tax=Mucilaginibacter sp. TaxID=1882438 RepID=UPI002C14F97E|nr:GrpB family protein [Mucilaginibacter sp.]HTI57717.1 GrpB family protein [Mucilaginibacter sp.]
MAQENWPVWATEAVIIEDYNSAWPGIAAKLIAELANLYPFDPHLVEHIGSTSVHGLSAKPIIDLIIPIVNFDSIEAIVDVLRPANWNLIPPELDGRDYRRTFVKVVNNKRFAHLHLVLANSKELKQHTDFRDILIRHPELVASYAQLKKKLAMLYKDDREKYSDAKTDFIKAALARYLS